jgi:AcrR family transcriptional regulator
VVTAAIGVADVEGGTGFSMRRLAAELGVSAMALYRHVQGKPDLLRAMAGRAFSEDPLPEAPEGWRRGLELAARREWEIYQRHPWVLEIVSLHRPLMIDSLVEHTEWSLGLLRRAGAEPDLALWAVVSLNAYTMGMAGQAVREAEEVRETGVGPEQWWSQQRDRVGSMEHGGRFPYLSELREPLDVDAAFEFGLARMLDGFAALVP